MKESIHDLTPEELSELIKLMRTKDEEPLEVEVYLSEQTPRRKRELYLEYTTATRSLRRPL